MGNSLVYLEEWLGWVTARTAIAEVTANVIEAYFDSQFHMHDVPVSYTHLTLPTIYSV